MFVAAPTSVSTETREFLARALPWPQEHEAPSYINVHYVVRLTKEDGVTPLLDDKGKQRIAVPGRACRNVDEAARAIEWANGLGTDIYVCMSAQTVAEEKISKRNFKYLKAVRRAENVLRHKSFYVDIDVKPGDPAHGYETAEEAVVEFVRIRNELGLPKQTFVVKSGSGGFHAHWCIAEPVAPEVWRSLSAALCAAFIAKGFRGDTQCIVDGVRLLRPPGTFNFKQRSAPQQVTLWGNAGYDIMLDSLSKPLEPYVGLMRGPAAKTYHINGSFGPRSKVFDGVVIPGLDAGLDALLPSIIDVSLSCPFVHRTLMTGGKDNANPLWLQTTNLALFVRKSRDAAHAMSNGHTTYSKEETDALVDRQMDTKRLRDLGWPRCATISSYGAPECVACPHAALGRSPLNFAWNAAQNSGPLQAGSAGQPQALATNGAAAPVQAGTASPGAVGAVANGGAGLSPAGGLSAGGPIPLATLAPLPLNYAYDQLNRVCLIATDETGKQTYEALCSFIMEKPWLQKTPPSLNFQTYTTQGELTQVRLPYEVINDGTTFKRTLGKQGMVPYKRELDDLGDFFVAWIDKLRADRTNVIQNQAFGWAVKGGKIEGFVYGGYLWSDAVPRAASNIDPVLASQYTPVGELQPWIDAAKMITNQERPALDAILASAFAAPLVRFTGQAGVLLSTFSTHSGIGKSTALKIGQSVWGNPTKAIQSLADTQNAVLKKIGDIKNLPLFWDELKTDDDTQRFINLAFQLSLGKEKSRLAADTSYRDPGTWQTLLCSTSNNPLLAYILSHTKTTTAGLYRVFEYEVPRGLKGQISPAEAAMIVSALNDNYGQAGVIYAQFLGTQHERIAKDVADYSKVLEDHYKIQADERFWLALVVTLVMGAVYANECSLTTIDIEKLTGFLIDKFRVMRNERTLSTVDIHVDLNVLGILSRYLNEHRQNYTLFTNIMWRQAGRPSLGQLNIKNTNLDRLRSVRIQVADDDHWVRMIKQPWDDWLAEKGLAPSTINKQLFEQFNVVQQRMRLGAGTMMATASELCIEFNYQDPVFQGMLSV